MTVWNGMESEEDRWERPGLIGELEQNKTEHSIRIIISVFNIVAPKSEMRNIYLQY